MQLKIKIYLQEPLSLPVAYKHILQSIFFSLMGDDNGQTDLHDGGYVYQGRKYKMFTFGPIKGDYRYAKGIITFENEIEIEFRSWDPNIIYRMANAIDTRGICFGDRVLFDIEYEILDYHITQDCITVVQDSPICVYKTDEKKHTYFFRPWDEEFEAAIQQNFKRKYNAAMVQEANGDVNLRVINADEKDKQVTKYKNFIIQAYGGTYQLTGNPEYLDFLYQTGIGAKNAQGFGMFQVIR